jgi:hypothetical protein
MQECNINCAWWAVHAGTSLTCLESFKHARGGFFLLLWTAWKHTDLHYTQWIQRYLSNDAMCARENWPLQVWLGAFCNDGISVHTQWCDRCPKWHSCRCIVPVFKKWACLSCSCAKQILKCLFDLPKKFLFSGASCLESFTCGYRVNIALSCWYICLAVIQNYHHFRHQRRDRAVVITTGYGIHDWGIRVRFPGEARYFSLFSSVQTGSGAHPVSYPISTRGSFSGDKAAGTWSWLPSFLKCRV